MLIFLYARAAFVDVLQAGNKFIVVEHRFVNMLVSVPVTAARARKVV